MRHRSCHPRTRRSAWSSGGCAANALKTAPNTVKLDAMAPNAAQTGSAGENNTKVFISYARADFAFVERLGAALKARGIEPLIDQTEIAAFDEWWKRIETIIARADTFVFVVSPDSVADQLDKPLTAAGNG